MYKLQKNEERKKVTRYKLTKEYGEVEKVPIRLETSIEKLSLYCQQNWHNNRHIIAPVIDF
jgi:hypothetical protein